MLPRLTARSVAEECAATEGAGGVHEALPFVREQSATPFPIPAHGNDGKRTPLWETTSSSHRTLELGLLNGCRIRLASRHTKAAAIRACLTRPANQQSVHFDVELPERSLVSGALRVVRIRSSGDAGHQALLTPLRTGDQTTQSRYADQVATAASRPRLRPVETVIVPTESGERALMLRDTQGIAESPVVLPIGLVPIVARFTGTFTCEEIARQVSAETGEQIPVALVVRLAGELEENLFADGTNYKAALRQALQVFADAEVREASHAGGAYYADPKRLAQYIERDCFGKQAAKKTPDARLVGLIAPHIDPWRGARAYGEAYGALGRRLPKDVDTFILFGTSHAPMREPFALCRKAFDTPLGRLDPHVRAVDHLAKACDFDPYADQFNHKREHSLEFQAVFLRHLLGDRVARIVPILAGLGEMQMTGESPSATSSVERFLDAVREVADESGAVIIAGADLAHVGPRFGDPRPLDEEQRDELGATDRESLDHAARCDSEGFWKHVAHDLDTRRVCGLAPIYCLLKTITKGAEGHLRHYEQTIDPDEGSIVSHAAVGYFA